MNPTLRQFQRYLDEPGTVVKVSKEELSYLLNLAGEGGGGNGPEKTFVRWPEGEDGSIRKAAVAIFDIQASTKQQIDIACARAVDLLNVMNPEAVRDAITFTKQKHQWNAPDVNLFATMAR